MRVGDSIRQTLERHTALPMAVTVGIGALLALGTLRAFDVYCGGGSTGLCAMIRTSPPWLLVTGLAATPSACLTWYWRTVHKKQDIAHALRAQISQRFATAVELLSEGRAGAVFALEQIARESPADHWPVMQTLSAFARRTMLPSGPTAEDICEAVRVIGRRTTAFDPAGATLDLSSAHIAGCDLRSARLDGASFENANLRFVRFDGASLRGVSFKGAHLGGAWFRGADLCGARMTEVTRDEKPFIYDNSTKLDGETMPLDLHMIGGSNFDGGPDPLAVKLKELLGSHEQGTAGTAAQIPKPPD